MKQQKKQAGITVFYSYASVDREWRDQLAAHLSQLKHDGLIEEWHDQQILAGSDRPQAIDQAIHEATIILLLISSDFLASDYCYENEMQRALERHRRNEARVIPIVLRPCDWQHPPLNDLQCLPHDGKPVTEWGNRDAAFLDITKGLRRVIEQQKALAHPPARLSQLYRQNRMRMLKLVQRIWIDGLLTQSLYHVVRIELCLQNRPDMLVNSWRLQVQELDQVPQALADGTTIVQVYDRAEGELLILGEPGAGKTTLLLELTRSLLLRATQNENLPLPVVFNLSTWAIKRQPLVDWLVDELKNKYNVSQKLAQEWVNADHIALLLDGLDEVASSHRETCIQASIDTDKDIHSSLSLSVAAYRTIRPTRINCTLGTPWLSNL